MICNEIDEMMFVGTRGIDDQAILILRWLVWLGYSKQVGL